MSVKSVEVLKFGGTSVRNPDMFRQSCEVVKGHVEQGKGLVVVVSAMAGITDMLHNACDAALTKGDFGPILDDIRGRHTEVISQLDGRSSESSLERVALNEVDNIGEMLHASGRLKILPATSGQEIISAGERMSAPIFSVCLNKLGIPACYIDARRIIRVDDKIGNASPHIAKTTGNVRGVILQELNSGKVVVIGGYYGEDNHGNINTFGRGGSDESATVLAKALDRLGINVVEVGLYKADVGGVMTADPKYVEKPKVIAHLTREETIALAGVGGKVLHPYAVQVLSGTDIKIICRSTTIPSDPGTRIDSELPLGDQPVKAVTALWPLTSIEVRGLGMNRPNIAGRIFEAFGRMGVNIRAINQPITEQVIQVVVPREVDIIEVIRDLKRVLKVDIAERDIQEIRPDTLSVMGVVGHRVKNAMSDIAEVIYHQGNGSGKDAASLNIGECLCSVIYRGDESGEQAKETVRSLHQVLFERA